VPRHGPHRAGVEQRDAHADQHGDLRRALRARQPLYAYDIKKPVVVKKGELVTLVFALPGIELTAQGQALADGGKGDVIAVLNARSRRTIEGRVSGPGTVAVQAPGAALALAQH